MWEVSVYPPTDDRRFRYFYQNFTNSILQQLKRNFGQLQIPYGIVPNFMTCTCWNRCESLLPLEIGGDTHWSTSVPWCRGRVFFPSVWGLSLDNVYIVRKSHLDVFPIFADEPRTGRRPYLFGESSPESSMRSSCPLTSHLQSCVPPLIFQKVRCPCGGDQCLMRLIPIHHIYPHVPHRLLLYPIPRLDHIPFVSRVRSPVLFNQ